MQDEIFDMHVKQVYVQFARESLYVYWFSNADKRFVCIDFNTLKQHADKPSTDNELKEVYELVSDPWASPIGLQLTANHGVHSESFFAPLCMIFNHVWRAAWLEYATLISVKRATSRGMVSDPTIISVCHIS